MSAKSLAISRLGDDGNVLLETAKEVLGVGSPDVQKLIEDMNFTCRESNSVGIAAPQVNRSLRIFLFSSRSGPRYLDAPDVPLTVAINPEILSFSDKKEYGWEGCLSVPDTRAEVKRAISVEVQYMNLKGVVMKEILCNLLARVFQHEYDHLNGILFIGLPLNGKPITEEEFQKKFK